MKMKKILILLFLAVAIFGIIAPINGVESSISSEDKIYSIDSKKKAASLKITWNGNGGKIGSKKTTVTTVQKGSTLNKIATTPKRSGYTFNGWYTQKTGGKKISKNTKPTMSVTFYAQWKKASVNSNIDSKLIGVWRYYMILPSSSYTDGYSYSFNKDGSFKYFVGSSVWDGKFYTSGGKIYLSDMIDKASGTKWGNKVVEYQLGADNRGSYLLASPLNRDETYFNIKPLMKFYDH